MARTPDRLSRRASVVAKARRGDTLNQIHLSTGVSRQTIRDYCDAEGIAVWSERGCGVVRREPRARAS